ncbi:mitochondrial fission ELM1 family protein [Ahrensia sp. R2A130]|uniref:mitochondrial fission ELM1 family protein n=1 Tax=Ahrensia sp. R2A130 TaxID=744979 RepID=UPI0001E0838A|nr:ELM1/GtrOC1 family putative glycosyltransferase [Ahrensia sp. R2A130]EFL91038.1 conserved hypothetical protein [Ahrensia sp. R2A130]
MRVLILTDGKAGDVMQCRGVALNLAKESGTVEERVVDYRPWHALPFMRPSPPRDLKEFDVVIASGRRAAPILCSIACAKDGPFTVFLKTPPWGHRSMDIIWVPSHDEFRSRSAIDTITGPHPITADALADERPSALRRFGNPTNAVGVLLGGNSGSVSWTAEASAKFAEELKALVCNRPTFIAASRRTPQVLLDAVANNGWWIWDGTGDNPYRQILSVCDTLVVTGDSHNMVSEAVSAAQQVHVFRPPGLATKFQKFLDALDAKGAIRPMNDERPFAQGFECDAAAIIADEIRKRMK